MSDKLDVVIERCKEVAIKAKSLYGVDLNPLYVEFTRLGRVHGTAWYNPTSDEKFNVQFNRDEILGDGLDFILNDTVPHEIAHLVCDYLYPNGLAHSKEWKDICIALGGSGRARDRISIGTTYYKLGTYQYIGQSGRKYDYSLIRHNRIQSGEWEYIWKNGDIIDHNSEYEVL